MQTDTVIYSGSVTKILFALLYSSSIQLESYFTNQQACFWRRKPIAFLTLFFDTKLDVEFFFGWVRDEEVVVEEGVVVTYSSLEMLISSCLGGIMDSLIFMKGLEEALVEFMVELFEEDEDGEKNEKNGLFNWNTNDESQKA
uniref:Uncharacterized protein n=1 Tax=Tanacetum cinerariifolium TaxID=118510 RepID=A0A6L2MBW2_TANCI|nr:hypothetical protein [Tanacetum cinerariifolium]